jgi:plasmid stabilization system protein ParE
MIYTVSVLPKARRDEVEIYHWLSKRSLPGAENWRAAYYAALHRLETDAASHAQAAEAKAVCIDLRESLFKTRMGRRYRILYFVEHDHVFVLRVRGPGQRPVRRRDLKT